MALTTPKDTNNANNRKLVRMMAIIPIFLMGCLVGSQFQLATSVHSRTFGIFETVSKDDQGVAAKGSDSDFALALEESLGFFNDVPEKEWELQRKITLGRISNEFPASPLKRKGQPSAWYQTNWDPDFSCRHIAKIGHGDGAKWICDLHRLVSQSQRRLKTSNHTKGCIVYSVGSNGNFDFEAGLHTRIPEVCEVHTFDYDDFADRAPRGQNIHFHQWGLKPSYEETKKTFGFDQKKNLRSGSRPFKTFEETKRALGHEGRPIDIFKIDCEGCEWSTYKDWISADIRQVVVEVHHVPDVAQDFFSEFQKAGYVIFSKEPNIQWGGGQCIEYSMLKLSTKFVEDKLDRTNITFQLA